MNISVCIPTANRPDLLREAVLSAWGQSVKPMEILIGDDSKDGNTTAVVDDLIAQGLPIRYARNVPGLGQAKNVQSLFDRATGEIITLLHDDDRYRPDAFARLLAPLVENPQVVASFGKQVIISEAGDENLPDTHNLNDTYHRDKETAGIIPNPLEASVIKMFPCNGYFVRRETAQSIDYYDNNRASKGCDFYFGFRLGQKGKPFFFIDEYTTDYRITRVSSARSGTNSGFYAMKICLEDLKPSEITPAMEKQLEFQVKVAIDEGCGIDKKLCLKWYFSKYHRKNILSLGGINRIRKILLA